MAIDHAGQQIDEQRSLIGFQWFENPLLGGKRCGLQAAAQAQARPRQMQFVNAPVAGSGAPFDESPRFQPVGQLAHAHLVDAESPGELALVEARFGIQHRQCGVLGGLEIGRRQNLVHDAKTDLTQPIDQERGHALSRRNARIGNMKSRRRFGAAWLLAGTGHEER
jgi:hypothetical protein